MMENLNFSEEEIEEQLASLGYSNIPRHRLREFKQDLDELIRCGNWESPALDTHLNQSRMARLEHSPPAYVTEKVGRGGVSAGEGFFLHEGKVERDREVLGTCQNQDGGWRRGWRDSYAQHSVAPKFQPPPNAPGRLRVESDPDDSLERHHDDSFASSQDGQERRFIRRKVLRKHDGVSLVCDESVYSEASEVASSLEDLHVSPSFHRHSETDNEDASSPDGGGGSGGTLSSENDAASLSAFDSYIRGITRGQSDGDLRPKPKSFLRPVMRQPALKKTDPVAKYFQYKQLWEMFKLPGEHDRRDVRWEIRERLAYQPPPPRPRRVLEPNTYVVPTEKKRSALRWEVRNDLANRIVPHKFSYRF